MSPPTELIEVVCPRCGESFAQWHRPGEETEAASSCTHCGHDPATDRLVHEDGVWSLTAEDEDAAGR